MKGPPIQRSSQERQAILDAIRQALEGQSQVVYAYAHGSFLEDRPFHDVDVAVYVDGVDEREMGLYALDLAAGLEAIVHLPVDVRVLNQAPLGFRYHSFRGELLCSRDDELRAQHMEQTAWQYLDLKPLQRRALKEAMTA